MMNLLFMLILLTMFFVNSLSIGNDYHIYSKSIIIPYENAIPTAIAIDQKGDLWVALNGIGALARLAPKDLSFKLFTLPSEFKNQSRIFNGHKFIISVSDMEVSEDGTIWFIEDISNSIICFKPAKNEFLKIKASFETKPFDLAIDENSDVWFAEYNINKIGRIPSAKCTSSDNIIKYELPNIKFIRGLDVRKGIVWMTTSGKKLVSFNPLTNELKEYQLPIPKPISLAINKDNEAWIGFASSNIVARLDLTTNIIELFPVIPHSKGETPYSFNIDPKGRLWFLEPFGRKVGILDPKNNRLVEIAFNATSFTIHLAIDKLGMGYISVPFENKIIKLESDKITYFSFTLNPISVTTKPGDTLSFKVNLNDIKNNW